MTNTNLLRAELTRNGYSQRSFCKEHPQFKLNTFNDKINNKVSFRADEIIELCELLNITDNNLKCEIFLAPPF